MCFTVSIDLAREELERRYQVVFPENVLYEPGYLFSAFDHVALPIITAEQPEKVTMAQWGLIPGWIKNRVEARKIRDKTVNARMETLLEKPSFRKAAVSQHCIVPVTGFFEWHAYSDSKYPYYLFLKETKSFALAGLYDQWVDRGSGEILRTFTLITMEASPLLARIHNVKKRMPAILPPENEKHWFTQQTADNKDIRSLLSPPGDETIGYHPVLLDKHRMKNGRKNPAAIQPYDYGFDPLVEGLF